MYKTITSQPGHQTGKDHSQKISIMVHAFKIEESLSGHPKTVKTFENCQEMWRLSSLLNIFKTFDYHNIQRLARHWKTVKTFKDSKLEPVSETGASAQPQSSKLSIPWVCTNCAIHCECEPVPSFTQLESNDVGIMAFGWNVESEICITCVQFAVCRVQCAVCQRCNYDLFYRWSYYCH